MVRAGGLTFAWGAANDNYIFDVLNPPHRPAGQLVVAAAQNQPELRSRSPSLGS